MQFSCLKPSPGHGLHWNTKFSPTALVIWEPTRLGQTHRQTDRRPDGEHAQFSGALFDNLPLRGGVISPLTTTKRRKIQYYRHFNREIGLALRQQSRTGTLMIYNGGGNHEQFRVQSSNRVHKFNFWHLNLVLGYWFTHKKLEKPLSLNIV